MTDPLSEEQYVEMAQRNRDKARAAKLGYFWCATCDREMVSQTEKCPVCGSRENRKKRRIPSL